MLTKLNLIKISIGVLVMTPLVLPQFSYADWSIGVGVGNGEEHHDHDRDHHDHEGDHHDGGREHHDEWRDHHDDWRERQEEHSFFYYHDHPDYGYHMHYIPQGGYTIWVNGAIYYYDDGLYYIREGFDYVLVNPPVGACVNAIPPDFQPVSINGRIYYTSNGIYYVLTNDHGYEVVPQPVVYTEPPEIIESQPQQVIITQPNTTVVSSPVNAVTQDTFPINIPNNKGGYTEVIIKKSGNGFVGSQGEFYDKFPKVSQLKTMYAK